MAQHGRVYKDEIEKEKRFNIFKKNVERIENLNGNAPSTKLYTLGTNAFTNLTTEEFLATHTGYKKQFDSTSGGSMTNGFRYENLTGDNIPSSIEWREHGAATGIKDQGKCGMKIKKKMGDVVVLQFQYRGIDVSVNVEDVDKVNLIDLIVEYWEKAKENNVQTPQNPTFQYVYKMKHVSLNCDADLMKMFSNLTDKKEIYVWVWDGLKDTKVVSAARPLVLGKSPMEVDKQVVNEIGSPSASNPKLTPRRRKNTVVEAEIISKEEFERHVSSLNKLLGILCNWGSRRTKQNKNRTINLTLRGGTYCVQENSCGGGDMTNAFEFIGKNQGISTDAEYPYTAFNGNQSQCQAKTSVVTINDYESIPPKDEGALLKAVSQQPKLSRLESMVVGLSSITTKVESSMGSVATT
uniref:Uncharacterized protein n=1 Tax=Chenopodium quinoa TaxID=63459 RepID=A0A803MDY6_CHEQI